MDSRITSGIRFWAMDGLAEAPDAPRNCEPDGTHGGIFWEKNPEFLDPPRGPLCKRGLRAHFPRPSSLKCFWIVGFLAFEIK